jgi:Zn-dependent protease with chaperone function
MIPDFMARIESVIKRRDILMKWLRYSNLLTILLITVVLMAIILSVPYKGGGGELDFITMWYLAGPLRIFIFILIFQRVGTSVTIFFMCHLGSTKVKPKNYDKRIGKFKVGQIGKMVDVLKEKMDVPSLKGVYIREAFRINAMAADTVAFRPLRRSVVIIHSNALEILNAKELEAIIAHEMGHIKNDDTRSLIYVINPAIAVSIVAMFALVNYSMAMAYHDFPFDLMKIGLSVLSVITLYGAGFIIVKRLTVHTLMRYVEHLADYQAVRYAGLLPTVNALIKVGQRNEAFLAFIKMVMTYQTKRQNKKERKQHMENIKGMTNPKEIQKYVMDNLVERDMLGRPIIKSKRFINKKDETEGQIPWKSFDTREPYNWLDYDELAYYVGILKEIKNTKIFTYEPRTLVRKMWLTHPTMEDRIVFLWDNVHVQARRPYSA